MTLPLTRREWQSPYHPILPDRRALPLIRIEEPGSTPSDRIHLLTCPHGLWSVHNVEPRGHRIGSSGTSYDESALCTRGLFLGIWGGAWVGGVVGERRGSEEDGWGGG